MVGQYSDTAYFNTATTGNATFVCTNTDSDVYWTDGNGVAQWGSLLGGVQQMPAPSIPKKISESFINQLRDEIDDWLKGALD